MAGTTQQAAEQALERLPATFDYAEALAAGLSKHNVYRLRDSGAVELVGHGLYRRADAAPADTDLIAIAAKSPHATLCLATALVHHGLADDIPFAPDIALPRGTHPPRQLVAQWHQFDPATFDIGRTDLPVDDGLRIGLYSAERSIVDAFRMRGVVGRELGTEALRQWLRRRGSRPSELLALAKPFQKVTTPLRTALELLG